MGEEIVKVTGVGPVDRFLAHLPDDAVHELQSRLEEFSGGEVARIRAAAIEAGALARMVSRSVAANGPQITVGGPATLPTGRGTFAEVFFGSEFGGGSRPETMQFQPYKPDGYWFFPTLLSDEDERLRRLISEALDAAIGA